MNESKLASFEEHEEGSLAQRKVSVIIPTYNRRDKIKAAIESALGQTYKNLEIIVVDDGSSDKTFETLGEYGDKIQYIYQENGGVSSARNRGVKKCSGDLVAFLDSDDRWLSSKIEKQIEFLNMNPCVSVVLCECYFMYENGQIFGQSQRSQYFKKKSEVLNNILNNPSFIPSSVLIEKKILFDIGLFDETLKTAEDQDMMLKLASKYQIGFLEEPLFNCMRGHDGLSQFHTTYDDTIFVVTRFLQNQKNISYKLKNKVLCKHYLDSSLGKCWIDDYTKMAEFFLKGLSHGNDFRCFFLSFKVAIRILRSISSKFFNKHFRAQKVSDHQA